MSTAIRRVSTLVVVGSALSVGCGPVGTAEGTFPPPSRPDTRAGEAGAAPVPVGDGSPAAATAYGWGGAERRAALEQPDDCGVLLEQLKLKAAHDVQAAVQSHLEMLLKSLQEREAETIDPRAFAVAYGPCGLPFWGGYAEPIIFSIDGASSGSAASATSSSASAQTYSTTNVQVAGVDEADFIKNDGSYLYVVAHGRLLIIQAWPPEAARIVASVELAGEPKQLYVHSDRALVYSSLEPLASSYDNLLDGLYPDQLYYDDSPDRECTYGYDCEFSGDGRALQITLLDISDRKAPTLLREIEINGSYLNSRRLGDIVHTVITAPAATVPEVRVWPDAIAKNFRECLEGTATEFGYSEPDVRRMFAELELDNLAAIENAALADFLPSVRDTRYVNGEPAGSESLLEQCDGFYLSQADDGAMRLVVLSLQMGDLADLSAATIVGKPGAVCASPEALYVATRHYRSQVQDWYFEESDVHEATSIDKFALQPESTFVRYVGSGVAKGRVLNQFSMDEYRGNLRIATTTGRVPDPDVHSTVTVLTEQDGRLVRVGMVDGIAPTEDIRSVRYDRDVGYVVTFEKTDPLFVLDLSHPEQPTLRGELHIPGYSTYLHLMDEVHLLTMGYGAEDQGDFAWFSGLQLQVINVADLDAPILLHRETIGTRGSTSDAATNHLAFNYFPELDLLAIPMTICEGGAEGSYGTEMTFSGLLVYRVTADGGFAPLGGVPHPIDGGSEGSTLSCYNWWTESDSKVKRSIFMESYVYSVALDQIRVSQLEDLEHPLASIDLRSEP
jgi:hypothetical protein